MWNHNVQQKNTQWWGYKLTDLFLSSDYSGVVTSRVFVAFSDNIFVRDIDTYSWKKPNPILFILEDLNLLNLKGRAGREIIQLFVTPLHQKWGIYEQVITHYEDVTLIVLFQLDLSFNTALRS